MISIKRYLNRNEDEAGYVRVISVLLSGIARHSLSASHSETAAFRDEIETLQATTGEDSSTDQLLLVAGATIQALESYNGRATRLMRQQSDEMQKMVLMFAQAIINISGESDRSKEALASLKLALQGADAIEDALELKLRLRGCLKTVCDEATRQKSESDAVLLELQQSVQNAQKSIQAQPGTDPITRLPSTSAARLAFVEGVKTAGRKYVVIMVVDRLQLINARFGNSVGDQLLVALRDYVCANVIAQDDRLFRWSGPTLVALISRKEGLDHVRNVLKRLLDIKIDNEFDVGGRMALIPLSVAWSVIGLIPPAANLPSVIDRFVAVQVPPGAIVGT